MAIETLKPIDEIRILRRQILHANARLEAARNLRNIIGLIDVSAQELTAIPGGMDLISDLTDIRDSADEAVGSVLSLKDFIPGDLKGMNHAHTETNEKPSLSAAPLASDSTDRRVNARPLVFRKRRLLNGHHHQTVLQRHASRRTDSPPDMRALHDPIP